MEVDELQVFELVLWVTEFILYVELKDSFGVVSDPSHVGVLEVGVYSDWEETVEVLDCVGDSDGVQQDLEGVDRHVNDVFIFCSEFEHIDHLINDSIFEILIVTKLIFEDDFNNSDELHELALFFKLITFPFLFHHRKL